ncbi:MAG TPA: glutamate 5-kinase [Clostridiales bacterium]|nr:glutamate 5-kinase [Clostridiales bacterium]
MGNHREKFKDIKRLVVKVGTSTLTHEGGNVNFRCVEKLGMVLSDIMNRGIEVILVSSGAIAVGVGTMHLKERPSDIGAKQATAAVGQCVLMNIYSKFFREFGKTVGQILLTKDILEDEKSKKNVINTFNSLYEHGVIPIVNENDSVATDEVEYGEKKLLGDNDSLSAVVACLVKADLLIILSDVDGFYSGDPRKGADCKIIDDIYAIDEQITACAGGRGTKLGTGGMVTKLDAARLVMEEGIDMVLANGNDPERIYDILDGEKVGTVFVGKSKV